MSDEKVRQDILLASITDAQGSIKANDAKCSAGLVVHGLLATATVAAVTKIGSVFAGASCWQSDALMATLAAAAASFLISVYFFLEALGPFRVDGHDPENAVFFPLPEDLRKGNVSKTLVKDNVQKLTAQVAIEELALERTKLAFILDHESKYANRGYFWLRIEVLSVVAFLVLLGAIAVSQAPN